MPPEPTPRLEAALAHAQFVRAVARGVLGGDRDVEDVLQETFLVASERAPGQPGALRAWLRTVARRLAVDRLRANSRRTRRERGAARAEALPEVSELLVREETRRRLLEAVACLDEPYRTTMLWHYYAGKSVAEIAALLAAPIDTVRTRLQRALARLRQDLDAHHGGDRGAWGAALLPLLGRPTGVGIAGSALGGLAVKKALVTAAILLAMGGGAWTVVRGRGALERTSPQGPPASASGNPVAGAAADDVVPVTLAAKASRPPANALRSGGAPPAFAGIVVDPDGRPIEGAEVSVYGFQAGVTNGTPPPSIRPGASIGTPATTTADGRFVLDLAAVPDASINLAVIVRVRAPGWSARSDYVRREEDARIQLARGGVAAIRVTDGVGRPIAGARATWFDGAAPLPADPQAPLPPVSGECTTADDGRASTRLIAGAYRIRVAADGRRPVDGDALVVVEGATTQTDVRLDEGIVAAFTVVDEAGAPVVGARVRTEGPRRSGATATTDAAGTCTIAGHGLPDPSASPSTLSRGEIVAYVVEADAFVAADGYRRLPPTPGPLAIEVRLVRGVTVRVRAADADGAPIPTASARWVALPNRRPLLAPSEEGGSAAPDGWIPLPRVLPGPARLSVGVQPEGTYEAAVRDVTIGPEGGDLTVAIARLDGVLVLRVLRADGAPASAVEVAFESTEVPPAVRRPNPVEWTGEDGRTRLARLRCGPGDLLLRIRGHAVQRFTVQVTPREPHASIVVRLRPTRPVAGRVETRDGTPVPDLGVDLYEIEPDDGVTVSRTLTAQTRTGVDGHFRFEVDGDRAFGLAVPGGVWMATRESLDAKAMPGAEDVVLHVKPGSEGWGLPVTVRATSAGRPYAGKLELSYTSDRGLSFALSQGRDASGAHRFGVWGSPGRYDLTLHAPGHRPTLVSGVTLDESPEGTSIDVALDRGAVVHVRVLDGSGQPLARAWVTLNGSDPVQTDDVGDCESSGWPPSERAFSFRVALAADPEYTVVRTPPLTSPGSTTVTLRRKAILDVSLGLSRQEISSELVLHVVDATGRVVDEQRVAAAGASPASDEANVNAVAYVDGPHRIEVSMGGRRGEATAEAHVGRRTPVRITWR